MPLSKPLPDLRRELQDILSEDLAAALTALKELLPEGSDKHNQVLALRARLNDTNKEHTIRHTISSDEYMLRVNSIRAGCLDLLSSLEEADFETPKDVDPAGSPTASAARHGSVLYRVPRQMPLRKPSICTIRVAIDEDAILEDIVIDDNVRFRQQVEVSDMMSAELLDPAGEVFTISALSQTDQLIRDKGYTQWLFSVTPRIEGEHQLLVKVSMMEYVSNLDRYVPREVTILETVSIVTETAAPSDDSDEAPLKPAGGQFALGQNAAVRSSGETLTVLPPSAPASAHVATPAIVSQPKNSSSRRPARTAVLFLAFAVLGAGATWALAPPPLKNWWLTAFENTAEAYTEYIEKYPTSSYREKALFRKADKTNALPDLRKYLDEYPQGQYRKPVLEKIKALENDAIGNIRQQPDAEKINRFRQDFPDSERMAEVMAIAQANPEMLPAIQPATADALVNAETTPKNEKENAPSQQSSISQQEQTKSSNPPPVILNRRSGLNMVYVKGGTYTMGDNSDKDICAHTVAIKNFEIAPYEVTQADWREVMGGYPTTLGFPDCDNCPVERVSWEDIQDFIKKANDKFATRYRLPTEAEWEYAARGGSKSKGYKYAGSNNLDEVAWYRNNSNSKTHPVGEKKANELALYDMSGNVYEWCQDKYGPYPGCPEPAQITSKRVTRGGNWDLFDSFYPVVFRFQNVANSRSSGVGFRLAR